MDWRRRGNAILRIPVALAAIAVACGGSTSGSGGAAGTGAAGTGTGGSGTGGSGTGGTGAAGTGGTGGAPAAVLCNGVTCAAHEECCLTSTKCFDPAAGPDACPVPTEPGPQGAKPCGATSQCGPGEYCQPSNHELCLGPGYCVSKTNCGFSSPVQLCGCNGVTYPDVQTACANGVAVSGQGPCGEPVTVGAGGGFGGKTVTYCATNANCKNGQQCCGITGQCYDPSQPALCAFPPPGTHSPCIDDTQCIQGAEYCLGDGCDGPGGCANIPGTGTCGGQLDPVCGCDGKSYVNADCAAEAATRIAHAGQCP